MSFSMPLPPGKRQKTKKKQSLPGEEEEDEETVPYSKSAPEIVELKDMMMNQLIGPAASAAEIQLKHLFLRKFKKDSFKNGYQRLRAEVSQATAAEKGKRRFCFW
jgi:hypothetical protein